MVADSNTQLVVATMIATTAPISAAPQVATSPGFCNNNDILPKKSFQVILASYPSLSPHIKENHQILSIHPLLCTSIVTPLVHTSVLLTWTFTP